MAPSVHQERKVAISNVRVFNGQHIGTPTTVVVEKGFISEDADGADIVDGRGGVLLPGLIDAHIHLNTEHELRAMAKHGITTALDMATWPPSKLNSLRGFAGVTDFRSPGVPATSPGSLHSIMLPIPREDLVSTPEDGVRFVQDRVAEGTDYIKMVVDIPGPDQPTLNSIVAEAHKHRKLVVAHASAFGTFKMAQDAGADVVTHAPRDRVLDHEACLRMLKENRISVPTLAMMEATTKPMSWTSILRMFLRPIILWEILKAKRKVPPGAGEQNYQNARDSVAALHRAGVPILAGTDAHEEPTSPFSVKHGDSLHHELELLVNAGLTTVEALQAATSLPAKYFGLTDRGVIKVGKRADLVLLTDNPIDNIQATRKVSKVWCAGVEVELA